ncbi:MAG: DNA translocase FtsK 4TM domain-containing protein [Pseudomonadota bacterium]
MTTQIIGIVLLALGVAFALVIGSYSPFDANWFAATGNPPENLLGEIGASVAGVLILSIGWAAWVVPVFFIAWGLRFMTLRGNQTLFARFIALPFLLFFGSAFAATHTPPDAWPHDFGLGGLAGDASLALMLDYIPADLGLSLVVVSVTLLGLTSLLLLVCTGVTFREVGWFIRMAFWSLGAIWFTFARLFGAGRGPREPKPSPPGRDVKIAKARAGKLSAKIDKEPKVVRRSKKEVDDDPFSARFNAEEELSKKPVFDVTEESKLVAEKRVGDKITVAEKTYEKPKRKPETVAPDKVEEAPKKKQDSTVSGVFKRAFGKPAADKGDDDAPKGGVSSWLNPSSDKSDAEPAEAEMSLEDRLKARINAAIQERTDAEQAEIAAAEEAAAAAAAAEAAAAEAAAAEAAAAEAEAAEAAAAREAAEKAAAEAAAAEAAAAQAAAAQEAAAKAAAEATEAAAAEQENQQAAEEAGYIEAVVEDDLDEDYEPETEPEPEIEEQPQRRGLFGRRGSENLFAGLTSGLSPKEEKPLIRQTPPPVRQEPRVAAPTPTPAPAPIDRSNIVEHPAVKREKPSKKAMEEAQPQLFKEAKEGEYELPPLGLLASPVKIERASLSDEALAENARMLETVLDDYGVKGEIVSVRPGPVVTMYELEPAPGLKASRVIGLADDIARSMSALSARVSTVPGRTVIGIELPNEQRETVFLREILSGRDYGDGKHGLPLALGKNIGGASVVADLTKMPHLLIAGTTGSGKSVAINTMILSLLYKLPPEDCRLILIDPKMLELSVYEGIPHLLSPVVTEPKKAVVALKWVVGEMEERYRKMSKMGVRNIAGYNSRVKDALSKSEDFERTVQTGFDDKTGEPVFETESFKPEKLPYIVVVVDEMADLMMVAGKEIEACIQRLAQMARASGIHLIMATQRPSVDVITGTIKANFPTRISFQVTSKVDSRTILGEMGAEQLLGMGDMLYMAGGGKITRVHGPFASDEEVEEVVTHLRAFGPPTYVNSVQEGPEDGAEAKIDAVLGLGGNTGKEDALYDEAVAIVARDRKASTSYIQRRLSIGYNKAARLVEQMEENGVVSPANHVGKREVLIPEEG